MKKFVLLLALFTAPVLMAQTQVSIVNPSFEVSPNVPNASPGEGGPWGYAPIGGWTATGGQSGLWQPDTSSCGYTSVPNGSTVLWNDGATVSQVLTVPAQANSIYTVTVYVGHRGCEPTNSYTITLSAGTTVLCSWTGSNSSIPADTFVAEMNTCTTTGTPPTGNLTISLASGGTEVDFDNVSISVSLLGPALPPLNLNIATKVVFCKVCDRTDDTPAQGSIAFIQGPVTNSFNFAADGSVAVNVSFDMSHDPVVFTTVLQNASGQQATGSGWTWSLPRESLSSGVSTLGTLSFGGLAFTVNADGTLGFAGFLPVQ